MKRRTVFMALGAAAVSAAFLMPLVAADDGWTGYVNPSTYPAENPHHSAASQVVSVNTGLVPGVGSLESLEARYCTSQESFGTISYDPRKFGTIIIVR